MKKLLISALFLCASAALMATPVSAETPSFPLCTNPQGAVIANYDTGSHAIAGQLNLQDGKDTVYAVDSLNQVTQCYCPPTDLNGIQTNWLDAATISEEEKQQLLSNGWVYIPNGSSWGLANDPYLAQNINYTCNQGGSSNPSSSTITAIVQSSNQTNNSSSNSSGNNPSSGSTLPNTGDSIVLFEMIGLGLTSISISFLLKKILS